MHVSDCSTHSGADCDCTYLDLAAKPCDGFIATLIPATGRFGFFVEHMGRDCFVEPHELPTLTLATVAAAANLPDAHDVIAVLRCANSVNLNDAREAVIAKLKTKTSIEGITSGRRVQLRVSLLNH